MALRWQCRPCCGNGCITLSGAEPRGLCCFQRGASRLLSPRFLPLPAVFGRAQAQRWGRGVATVRVDGRRGGLRASGLEGEWGLGIRRPFAH